MTYPSSMRYRLIFVLLALSFVACNSDPGEPTATPTRVEGVIVGIDSAAIDDVNGFTLKDGDVTYEIKIADDVDYGFPLGHLQEHLQSADPVGVDLEERDGDLYALTIEDL